MLLRNRVDGRLGAINGMDGTDKAVKLDNRGDESITARCLQLKQESLRVLRRRAFAPTSRGTHGEVAI